MRRFFFDPNDRNGENILLSEEESYHLTKVLRLRIGAAVEVLDGTGVVFRAVIVATGRRAEVRIERILSKDSRERKNIWVGQGILKGDKMDTVIQKCTELGVHRITPFHSSRCQGKLNLKQSSKKYERWRRIGLAACKQCLRTRPLQLDTPVLYDEWLNGMSGCENSVRLLFWEEEKDIHLQDIPDIIKSQSIGLMLGPEGGFSQEEIDLARSMGWRTVSLGERILRAETATFTAVSIVQYLAGNL